jgi:hypothetical protein
MRLQLLPTTVHLLHTSPASEALDAIAAPRCQDTVTLGRGRLRTPPVKNGAALANAHRRSGPKSASRARTAQTCDSAAWAAAATGGMGCGQPRAPDEERSNLAIPASSLRGLAATAASLRAAHVRYSRDRPVAPVGSCGTRHGEESN